MNDLLDAVVDALVEGCALADGLFVVDVRGVSGLDVYDLAGHYVILSRGQQGVSVR